MHKLAQDVKNESFSTIIKVVCHVLIIANIPPIWLQMASAGKLKPLELELKKLEDLSESIVKDFAYMRAREEEMRDTNGKLTSALL